MRDFVVCLGTNVQFVFGDHTLDGDRRELLRGSESIAVEPQVFDLLVFLVENRDRVVSKDDLIASIWRWEAEADPHYCPQGDSLCGRSAYAANGFRAACRNP